jgi:23S rRNA (guanosine2251-2'-O)-methyltransferase
VYAARWSYVTKSSHRSAAAPAGSPRDKYITIYGRNPVLEALRSPGLSVAKVMVAENAHGGSVDRIIDEARERGIEVRFESPNRIKLLAGNGKQDQGVIADVAARRMASLDDFLDRLGQRPAVVFLLDGVTNPSNVGMILRSATAAGIDGVILPRAGTPHVGPLVIKASAGVAFDAPILNAATAASAASQLRQHDFSLYGLAAGAPRSIFGTGLGRRAALVLGGETGGLTISTDTELAIPMRNGVESLNVAVAASIVAFQVTQADRSRR